MNSKITSIRTVGKKENLSKHIVTCFFDTRKCGLDLGRLTRTQITLKPKHFRFSVPDTPIVLHRISFFPTRTEFHGYPKRFSCFRFCNRSKGHTKVNATNATKNYQGKKYLQTLITSKGWHWSSIETVCFSK
jgi:hypothetical protein